MFDIHTHLWDTRCLPPSIRSYFPQREGGAQCLACSTAEDLISEMDQSGIEKAIVLALAFQPDLSQTAIRDINDYVIAQTSKSDRLAAFCTINPHDGRDSIPLLEEYILKKGCKGLKLHGSMQESFILFMSGCRHTKSRLSFIPEALDLKLIKISTVH